MPKINRIRIVNFSYNNNNRHILDETFDFYSGENALLSLANGGGKSVLVQIMLQPILPKATLLGRKIGDFFAGRNTPSYILIEWKLDDGAGYLLTGIGLMPNITHSANEEEQATGIRYFTFYNEYLEANPFDIQHIPVTEHLGSNIKIAAYTEFRKYVQKETDKYPHRMGFFASSREDQRSYQGKLGSYGISMEEWKELMVKINEAEHGVSEVFTKCKTSKMVMEQWIIKYIEQVLNKSNTEASDHKKLETMMSQVALSLVENEHHIKEYQRISGFMQAVREVDDRTKTVLSSLDEEMQLKKSICNGYQVIKTEEGKLEQESIDLEARTADAYAALDRIGLEEKSLEIYHYLQEMDDIAKDLSILIEEQARTGEALQRADFQLRIQQAAEKYNVIQEKKQRIAVQRERLANAVKDQTQLMADLDRIRFNLKLAYEQILIAYSSEFAALKEQEAGCRDQISQVKSSIISMSKQLNQLNHDLGGIQKDIRTFEAAEPSILEELGLELNRNPLLRELSQEDLKRAAGALEKAIAVIENDIAESHEEMETLEEAVRQLEMDRDNIQQRRLDTHGEWVKTAETIKSYEAEKEKVVAVLSRHNLQEKELFEPETVLKRLQDKIDDWSNKSFYLKMDIAGVERLLKGIEEGVSYLPARLVAILKEHNLPCYTGEQYLKEIDAEKKRVLLEQNPLLPYALILTEKEYEQLSRCLEGEELSQIVPVIRYQDREMHFGDPQESLRFFASAEMMNLKTQDIDAYIVALAHKKETMLQELKQAGEVLENTNQEYQVVSRFPWEKVQVDALYGQARRLQHVMNQLDDETHQIKDRMVLRKERQGALGNLLKVLDKKLVAAMQRKDKFHAYMEADEQYIKNLGEASRLKTEILQMENQLESSARKTTDFEKQLKAIEDQLRQAGEIQRATQEKYDRVKDAAEAEQVEGSLNELEGRLKAYQAQQTNQVEEIEDQIDALQTEIRREERLIQKLAVNPADYQGVSYSKSLEEKYEEEGKALALERKRLDDRYHQLDKKRSGLDSKKSIVERNLNGKPIIPPEEILGNFDGRRQRLKDQIKDYQNRDQKIREGTIRINKLLTKIESSIVEIARITPDDPLMSFEETDGQMESMLEQYVRIMGDTNKGIDSFHEKIRELGYHYRQTEGGIVHEALRSIQIQVDSLDRTYDKYYYLSERLDSCCLKLKEVLKIMEEKVLQLQHDQKDLVEHAFLEVMRIYHEIPKISENSSVEIDGVRRRVLEIQYEEITDELAAREKMSAYIHDCLETLKKLLKDKEDDSRIRRELEKFISTKELLNVISSLENCVVKAYKVDINEKNRRMMPWEEIIVKNSGGEKFVAYFSLLVALIAYSRGRSRNTLMKKEETKVLIMDNPFGPITSGHLLKPMFDIADKYNTQLICLSDIKQGAVINSFDLVYMVKIRQNMMRDEYLEFEPHVLADLKADEKLEKAYLYTSEQMDLFG